MPNKQTKEAPSSRTTDKEFLALLKRAEQGDESAMPAIREAMKGSPGLWEQIGDLAASAERSLLQVIGGDNLYVREGVQRHLRRLRGDLLGSGSSPLERLLVERIAACWLQLQYADAIYAQNMKDMGIPWSEHHQRRIDRAHRRFLSAIKTLATVRKLALPVLQVNIGDKQVNVAGGAPPQASATAPRVVAGSQTMPEAKETAAEAQKGLPSGT